MARTFVIVGAGLAGAKAAQGLREEGFDGRLVLLGAEAEPPYERPPLSKDYLRGEREHASTAVHEDGFYAAHDIELRTGTVVDALDTRAREVVAGGERLRYDRLLLATGARPRRLELAGGQLEGIHELRTLRDADGLRAALLPGARVIVVGAGWIGCEVAASARQLGCEVEVVEPLSAPLERVLGAQLGAVYRDLHAANGVAMHLGTGVVGFGGSERVGAVLTSDGRRLPCDLVVVGAGVTPRSELAGRAGIEVGDGIVVDEFLRTSAPDVFAAGDVAAAWQPSLGRRLRVEHWANALHHGLAAAHNMLGRRIACDRPPYFFSDQYDAGMEYSGFAEPGDELVVRGDLEAREFIAFWLREGAVVAGMNVNVWDVTNQIQALIRSGERVDRGRLADPDVGLDELLTARKARPSGVARAGTTA
jgi:3-phenylpropionate/trans-cinnamate dioxygenase ferredoxin reductase subunit